MIKEEEACWDEALAGVKVDFEVEGIGVAVVVGARDEGFESVLLRGMTVRRRQRGHL